MGDFNDKGQRILYYWHRVANFILTTITNILTNINFSDMETGYKVFKASVIKDLDLKEDSFGIEPEITVKLARKKVKFYITNYKKLLGLETFFSKGLLEGPISLWGIMTI